MALDLKVIIEKRLEKIRSNSVPSSTANEGSFFAVNKSQRDVYLDGRGVSDYFKLLKFINDFIHPGLGVPLREIHGVQAIEKIISNFLRLKKPNYDQLKDHLLPKRTADWNIFIKLKWVGTNHSFQTPLGIIHPPGLPDAKALPQSFKKKYDEELQAVFVEIQNIKSKNEEAAYLSALEMTKILLSQISNRNHSLILKYSVDVEPFYIVQKITTGAVWFSSSVSHRGISYDRKSKYDNAHLKHLQLYLNDIDGARKVSPALFNRVGQGCIALQNAKTTCDEATKLLLLVVALDTLLMEKFYRPGHGRIFTKRLLAFSNNTLGKMKNPPDTNFLNDVYEMRNTIAHTAKRHKLATKEDYHHLEVLVHGLALELSATKAPSHAEALSQVGLLIT
jgi:hypothetical protein